MKKIALWAMCIAVMVLSGCRKAPEWKAEHVFVIGLDGWGAYSVEKADMPKTRETRSQASSRSAAGFSGSI